MKKTVVSLLGAVVVLMGLVFACSNAPPAPPEKWTVKFNLDGGNVGGATTLADVQVIKGRSLGSGLKTPAKNGSWEFGGWFDESVTPPEEYTSTTPIAKNLTLTAHWTNTDTSKWTVTFNTDGGSAIESILVTKGGTMGAQYPANPTKGDDTFDGWYLASDTAFSGTQYNAATVINADTALKAKWTAASTTWTVNFDLDGGNVDGAETLADVKVTKGESLGDQYPQDPEKDGSWEFGGWFDMSVTPHVEYDSETSITKNLTLTAHWTNTDSSKWAVTFNTDSDSHIESILVTKGESMGAQYPQDPVRGTDIFDGWYLASDTTFAGTKYIATTPISGDIELKAKWTQAAPETWTVTFNADGGTPSISSIQVIKGEGMGAQYPQDPVKGSDTFDGWYLASDTAFSGTKYIATTSITGDTNLIAKWTPAVTGPKNITVDFNAVELTAVGSTGVAATPSSDGTSYNFKYGSGGYQSDWAKFTLTLGAGLTLADYEKVTFTMQGVAGDTGNKKVTLLAASTLTALGGSDPSGGALDVGTTPQNVNGNSAQNISIAINPTKAAGLSGTIEFCIYDHSGSSGSTTEWKISNVEFHAIRIPSVNDITVNFNTVSLTAVGTGATAVASSDGTSYNFKYGSGGYQSDWAKFTLTLGAGLTLADYEKVTFTMQGIAGDTGSKNVALIAASPTLTISSDPRNGALDVGTTDPGVNGNTVQSIEIAINPTKAAGLSGTIEFCFYDHSGSNSSTTEWKISNVVFWFKNDS